MFGEIDFETAEKLMDPVFVDVRSPGEYQEATIPGAINIPLFSDEERAQIGSVYKRESQNAAKILGLQIASGKLPSLVQTFQDIREQGQDLVVFCWRGGMRSKTVATVLDLMGIQVFRMTGGYRAYREHVTESLESYTFEKQMPICVVLHGLTGVGKTLLLQQMHTEGLPVLDLEKLAGHKGSVFGGLGETDVRNQRMFDSMLYEELKRLGNHPYLLVEAESKRIGHVMLPDFLMQAKENGLHISVQAPLAIRVQRTMLQYPMQMEDLDERVNLALQRIKRRVPPTLYQYWLEALQNHRYEDLIESLLRDYYDPRYQHAFDQYEGTVYEVDASNLQECKRNIIDIVDRELVINPTCANV